MAALNFPEAIANGQVFEADTGVIYTYIGTPPNGYWSGFAQDAGTDSLNALYVEKNDKGTRQTITGGGGLDLAGTIQLNSLNGSATFNSTVTAPFFSVSEGSFGADNIYASLQNTGDRARLFMSNTDALGADEAVIDITKGASGTEIFRVNANGSAEFADHIKASSSNLPHHLLSTVSSDAWCLIAGGGVDGNAALFRGNGEINLGSIGDSFTNPTVKIKADGSASFAGDLQTGLIDIATNDGRGCEVRADGLVRAQRPTGSSGSAVFQAWNGNFNSAYITAGGSAMFKNNVDVDQYLTVTNSTLSSNAKVQIQGDNDVAISVYPLTSGARSIELNHNGSATFGVTGVNNSDQGSVEAFPVGRLQINGTVPTVGEATSYFIECNNNGADKFIVRKNGSAVFAADVTCSGLVSNRTGGTDEAFSGRLNGSITSSIKANGSADFQGLTEWKRNTTLRCRVNPEGTSSGGEISLNNSGGASTIHLYGHNGVIDANNVFFSIEPDNDANYTTTTEEYTETESYTGPLGNTLEREVTKSRDIRTYTGPTLDVKERLQNLIARLDSLEAEELADDATSTLLLTTVNNLNADMTKTKAALTAIRTAATAAGTLEQLKADIATATADI